jgi:uncharacterized protein (TIGR03435 family)
MSRLRSWLAATTLSHVAAALPAPAPTTPLSFEVASIKPDASGAGFSGSCHGIDSKFTAAQLTSPPPLGRCVIRSARLGHLIFIAYGLASLELLKSDSNWIDRGSERFDIEAEADDPAKTTEKQLLEMLQTLLVDRFKLRFHREAEKVSGLALEVAKNGPKALHAAALSDAPDMGSDRRPPGEPTVIKAHAYSMPRFAQFLWLVEQMPVIDQTGLRGSYDFMLTWDDGSGPSLFTALTQQLGLRLKPGKVTVSAFVVDSAQRPAKN